MRDLIVAVLGGLILTFGLTCAMNKGGAGPEVEVRIDNQAHRSVDLLFFDSRNGDVRARIYNVPGGRHTRSVEFRDVRNRQLGVAIDRSGSMVPHPAGVRGADGTPKTITVRKPGDLICVTAGSETYQDDIYMHSCA